MRHIRLHTIAASMVMLLSIPGRPAEGQGLGDCTTSGSVVRGTISDISILDIGWVHVVSSSNCAVSIDSSGSFELPTKPGRQVLAGIGPGGCLMATEVVVPEIGEIRITLQGVPLKSPLDDTVLLLPGAGYMPPTYSDRQCRASYEYVRQNPGITSLEGAPHLPTPDSVVALILRSDTLSAWLRTESPLQFTYWNEPSASPRGVVDGKSYEIVGPSARFVIVESLTPSNVDIRVGSADPRPGSSALWRVNLLTGATELLERFEGTHGRQ